MYLHGSRIVVSQCTQQFKMCRPSAQDLFACVSRSKQFHDIHMSVPPSSLSTSSSTSSTSQVTLPINKHCDDPQNEEYGSVAKTTSSTDYEPSVIDTSTTQRLFQRSSRMNPSTVDTEPSYSFEAELDDELIRKSDIFTTVHSGARRISELETNLSLS